MKKINKITESFNCIDKPLTRQLIKIIVESTDQYYFQEVLGKHLKFYCADDDTYLFIPEGYSLGKVIRSISEFQKQKGIRDGANDKVREIKKSLGL